MPSPVPDPDRVRARTLTLCQPLSYKSMRLPPISQPRRLIYANALFSAQGHYIPQTRALGE
jgi:hypothetical protein